MPETAYLITGLMHETRFDEATQRVVEGHTVNFTYGEPPRPGHVFVEGAVPDQGQIRAAVLDYVQRATAVLNLTD